MKKLWQLTLIVTLFTVIGVACAPAAPPTAAPTAPPAPAVTKAPSPAATAPPTRRPTAPPKPAITKPPAVKAPSKPQWQQEWDKTVEAAKKEGTVMIYSTPSGEVLRVLADAFEGKFGIKVEFVNGRGEELTQRMQAEKAGGRNMADVVMSGGTTTLTVMKPRGLLDSFDGKLLLPEVTDPKAWLGDELPFVDKDHTSVAMMATYQRYVMLNTDLVPNAKEITSYRDLLNPKWKGKMTINDPTVTGTGNAFFAMLSFNVWNEKEMLDFMRKFVAQQPAVTRDRRIQGEWVARGKYPVSVATNMQTAIDFIRLGSPIAFADVKEGGKVGAGAGGMALPATPAHPNASRVFANWLLTKEGQDLFVKAYGSPSSRKDATTEGIPPEMVVQPGDKFYFDTEEDTLYRKKVGQFAKEIFAPVLTK